MSVINKMLRDLDDRQASGTLQVRVQDGRDGIARDTQSIRGDGGRVFAKRQPHKVMPWAAVLVGVLLLAAALTWWWIQARREQPVAPVVQLSATAAPVVPALTPPPAVAAASTASKGQPKSTAGTSAVEARPQAGVPKAAEASLAAASRPAIPAMVARNLASLPQLVPEPGLRVDSAVRPASGSATSLVSPAPNPVSAPPAPTTPPAANSQTVSQTPARPSPVMEALAQAQALWAAGSRVGAIELLKDAIAVAERSPGSAGSATLAALARELGRMELAEGRAAAALDMLTRLEPGLAGVADIWALRGNAAQRLGRHEESSTAYLTALKLKPGEPRWMLGAAVSLAAQGQTGAAAEWAEQARASGALSREVAAYLQQLGVPLRER